MAKQGDGGCGWNHHTDPLRYRPDANSLRVSLSRSGKRAEPQAHPRQESTAKQFYHANVAALPDRVARVKLPDYIEVILHCKGVSHPLIRRAYILRRSDPDAMIASLVTVTRHSGEMTRHSARS